MSETARAQAKSGLRWGVGAGLFLIWGMLLSSGLGRVVWSAVPPHRVVWPESIGWLELALAAAILLSTTGVWWQLLAGYMLIGAFKCVIVLVTGHDLFAPYGPFPRLEAAELMVFAVATVALMLRFAKSPLTILDRVGLTAFVFAFVWHADRAEFSASGRGLAVVLLALLIPWCVHWWNKRKHEVDSPVHISD
jgi:hypothetical protein